ncbi:hypothetical protein AMTR_s00125p00068880 [Amborella trichopoda]|uniref:Uncharacterized protein n=1 Tax=Amborella trichopoda TaxID=13333 RepID=W1NNS9_AMBTC|nr:hypothetical protein AMTR_s00125p00068880 [Amborella trichopoda]
MYITRNVASLAAILMLVVATPPISDPDPKLPTGTVFSLTSGIAIASERWHRWCCKLTAEHELELCDTIEGDFVYK